MIWFLLALILIITVYVWFFVYNKQHVDVYASKPDYTVKLDDLTREFTENIALSQQKYADKIVEFTGTVDEVLGDDSLSSIIFKPMDDYTVTCEVLFAYNKLTEELKKGDVIEVKGLFIGFMEADSDFEMPGDIKFRKCSFIRIHE